MKKIVINLFVLSILLTSIATVNAQKIAHVSIDSLFNTMPEFKIAKEKSDVKLKELESFLGSLKTKYDESLQKYQEGYNTMSEFERKSQEEELTTMQTRIQTKQQEAQQDYQAFTTAMQKPIYDKVNAAITEVAKEYKYSYVLSKMDGVVLYADPADDILLLVKKQLNKMPAAKLPEVGGGSTKPVPSGQTKPSVPRK